MRQTIENPLISIIVPIFNVEIYLKKCLDSILKQTYSNTEIILVNDGSTDGCLNICKEYAKKHSNIIIIDKENGGLSDARNAGIERASGDYLGFVDSDDWIEPNMYEILLKKIISGNYDIAICGLIREYPHKVVYQPGVNQVYGMDDALAALIEGNELYDHAWSKLYKRNLFEGVRYPKGKLYEDIRTTYKLFLNAKTIVSLSTPLYHYRQRGGSIIRGNFNQRRYEIINAVEEITKDERLYKWNNQLIFRMILAKYSIIFELANIGDLKMINTNWHRINNYFYEIKKNRQLIKNKRIPKGVSIICKLWFIPNILLFFIISRERKYYRNLGTY